MTRVLLGTLATLVVLLVAAFAGTRPSTSGPEIGQRELASLIAQDRVDSAVLLEVDRAVQGNAATGKSPQSSAVSGPFHAPYPADDEAAIKKLLVALERRDVPVRVDAQAAKGIARPLATTVLPILLLVNLLALLLTVRRSHRPGSGEKEPGPASTDAGAVPVDRLLAAIRGHAESPLGRELTAGERAVLAESGLAWRLRWMVLRRVDDDGNLIPGFLREALRVKRELFPLERYPQRPRKPTPNPGSNWLSIGPRNINGRIRALAVHPDNPDIIYAGAAAGGVWKTQDGGRSWRPMMHEEESLAVAALAIDPKAPETIYAGTGEPVYVLSKAAEPPDPMHAWFYEGIGVLKSSDGGESWGATPQIENDYVYALAVDPQDSSNVLCAGYAAAAGKGGLCRLADGDWTTAMDGVFTDVLFDASDPGTAYAAQHGGGVFKSEDHGQTWKAMSDGLGDVGLLGRISLTLATAATPSGLYAQVEDAALKTLLGVYRYGATQDEWTRTATQPGVYGPGDTEKKVYWCSTIAVDPTDGNTVWSGGTRMAFSSDGGDSWTLATGANEMALPHCDVHDVVFAPGQPGRIIVATDGGVFSGVVKPPSSTSAVPVEWKKISAGLVVTQFYDLAWSPACESRVGGGCQDNGSLLTTGGRSWRQVLDHDGGYMAFHPTDPYLLFAQKPLAYFWRSDDGGQDFDPFRSGIDDYDKGDKWTMANVLAMHEARYEGRPTMLFAGTDRVYRAAPSGPQTRAWNTASDEIGAVTEISVAASDPSVVYAGTIGGGLFRADDGGATPTSFKQVKAMQALPKRWLSAIAIHPDDPNTIFVAFLGRTTGGAGTSRHVWKGTIDPKTLTSTWQLRSHGLLNVPVGALVIDPQKTADGSPRRLFVACDIGVFRSTDDGITWAPFEAGLPNVPVVDLALDPVRRILYAATHGRGAYKLHLDTVCPDVALCIRDNLLDNGDVAPSPSGVPDPWRKDYAIAREQSPDIKVFAEAGTLPERIDGVEFDGAVHTAPSCVERIPALRHANPVRGQEHTVGVQVHNFGWQTGGPATVTLLWAPLGPAANQPPPLPKDFWQKFPGDGALAGPGPWTKIGEEEVENMLPDTPWVAVLKWKVPKIDPVKACLLAIVDAKDDPVKPESERLPAALVEKRRQIAYRLVDIVDVT